MLRFIAGLLLVFILSPLQGLPAQAQAQAHKTMLPPWPTPALTLHVSPQGNDAAAGTAEAPFATLDAAREALRRWRQASGGAAGPATVLVHGGRYETRASFQLSREDSGTEAAPVRYCAVEGEQPVFSGGVRLEGFAPLEDAAILARLPEESRGKVLCLGLEKYGMADLKPLRLGGFTSGLGFKTHPVMELFFDGKAMPMSRWPNEGFVRVAEVSVKDGTTMHGRVGSKIGRILYEGDRPARWKEETAPLLYGYWFFDWADSYERISRIDQETHEFVLEEPYSGYGYRAGAPYYALNLLSEIDLPGEWYLDRQAKILYFYPPADPASAEIALSVAEEPFVTMTDVSNTSFEGFTWELGGVDGVIIEGGEHCRMLGCTVRRGGGDGIVVRGGREHLILGCEVYSMGRGGVVIEGGDRKTLTPGGHVVENCDIHELSRIDHTYTPAVLVSGAGNRVAHNALHDIPSSAIRLGGNDNVVEYNDIHHVVQESDDQGGADMWGDPTFRGNIYRFNLWRNIGEQAKPAEQPECGQAGIRLDDAISGTLIYGNVFYRASAGKTGFGGVQIHGGKDNVIENNIFVDCMAAISFSPWDEKRWRDFVAPAMGAADIDPELYVQRYPQLGQLLENCNVNSVKSNLILRCGQFLRRDKGSILQEGNTVLEAVEESPQAEPDWAALDALGTAHGLQHIPIEEIGRYKCAERNADPGRS